MAESNIEKYNKRLTQAERKENASKAGIASGKARKENRPMKETLETLLQMPLKPGKAVDVESIINLASLKGKNITVQEAIMLGQIQKAMKGDTKAAEYIRDTVGQKPVGGMSIEVKESEKLADVFKQIGGEGLDE